MERNTTNQGQPGTVNETDKPIENKTKKVDVITQDTRFVLLQNILSHPQQLPTLKELDYVNPSKSKRTIRVHLEELIGHGIVTKRTLPKENRQQDLPWEFYEITEAGQKLLEETGLLGAEGTLQEMYNMLEPTAEIEKYAKAPRPETDT